MKAADTLRARLGGNMKESMGATRPAAPIADPPAAAPALHGETPAKYQGAARVKDALAIEVDRIMPDPDQPRKKFDPEALAELAASMKTRGQLQPIRVRWNDAVSRWNIVVGERRYRAALLAGLPTLICIAVKGSPTADEILEDQLVENCLRTDLRPVEQARAFRALIDRRGWSYRQLAERLHIAPASVARALALLDLPSDLQGRVEAGELAPSVAYEVSRLDDPNRQREVADEVVSQGLNRSAASEAVRRAAGKAKGKGAKAKARKVTSRIFRTASGPRVTVEYRRGLDATTILAALRDATSALEAELSVEGQAAA
jgi:ParB family chromosome partitioning protein